MRAFATHVFTKLLSQRSSAACEPQPAASITSCQLHVSPELRLSSHKAPEGSPEHALDEAPPTGQAADGNDQFLSASLGFLAFRISLLRLCQACFGKHMPAKSARTAHLKERFNERRRVHLGQYFNATHFALTNRFALACASFPSQNTQTRTMQCRAFEAVRREPKVLRAAEQLLLPVLCDIPRAIQAMNKALVTGLAALTAPRLKLLLTCCIEPRFC